MTESNYIPKGRIFHNCKTQGCYTKAFCPDWSTALDWFPRGITPSDVDGIVEINGALLFVEFKPNQASVTVGQRRLLRQMTWPVYVGEVAHDRRNYSILAVGDPKTLEIVYMEIFKLGSTYECWPQADKGMLERLIRSWVEFVEGRQDKWPTPELCKEKRQ